MASVIQVSNETKASFTRSTKDGRTLTYELQVLQQPQRARACGSGAKSSADRRPVDPPPVVELKVLEGKEKTDITFQHNANFFLFTTLESARQIAPVRGSSTQTPLPVLTGMPVAGMAYLDRPTQAGYFIFPDLSVRHEGKYRLSFNLFEELKETKDMDVEPLTHGMDPHGKLMNAAPMIANSHVHFRLEVKSEPFVVYSAKKFPGLAESTSLSRVVAEQGCRVRIRRDVRMRRRDTKASKDYDEDDYDGQGYRDNRFQTPDTYGQHAVVERSRSVSNTSVDGSVHYPAERRPSTHESAAYYQPGPYQQAPPAPISQTAPASYQSHLSFGSSGPPPYQAPHQAQYAPAPASAPAPVTSSYQQYSQPQPHVRQMSNGSNYNYSAPQPYQQPPPPPPQQYQSPPSYSEPEYRRPMTANQPTPYAREYYPAVDTRFAYSSPPQSSDPRSSTPTNSQQLPPLRMTAPPERKYEQPSAPMMSIPSAHTSPQPYDTYSSYSSIPQSAVTIQAGKRSYGKVFDQGHLTGSVSQGARPDVVGQDVVQVECDGQLIDEDDTFTQKMLTYRRADGSRQHKKIPSPI
ncbi:MAG: velvet protein [Stictis urceolatum]|nr:velvet protein [Stictis urceolata]